MNDFLRFIIKVLIVLTFMYKIVDLGQVYVQGSEDENDELNYSDYINSQLNEYDYSKVNKLADTSFKDIVSDIIHNKDDINGVIGGIAKKIMTYVSDKIQEERQIYINVLVLACISAIIKVLGGGSNYKQLKSTVHTVVTISLITILFSLFYKAAGTASDMLETLIIVYKSLVPIFFGAVSVASGSATSAAYYEIILIIITVINTFFLNVLINNGRLYVIFSMIDSCTEEAKFTKIREILLSLNKWSCKTVLIVFTGLGSVKAIFNPLSDSLKNNILLKSLGMVPGIGNTAETISKTVIGAGTIVKNGIGVAAIVVLVMVSIVPLVNLCTLAVTLKILAAVIEPIADKRIVDLVSDVSSAIGMLLLVMLSALSLFILMLAIICVSTNYNYLN